MSTGWSWFLWRDCAAMSLPDAPGGVGSYDVERRRLLRPCHPVFVCASNCTGVVPTEGGSVSAIPECNLGGARPICTTVLHGQASCWVEVRTRRFRSQRDTARFDRHTTRSLPRRDRGGRFLKRKTRSSLIPHKLVRHPRHVVLAAQNYALACMLRL